MDQTGRSSRYDRDFFSGLAEKEHSIRERTTRRCATVAGPTPSTWSDTWRGRAGCRPGGGARPQRAGLRRGLSHIPVEAFDAGWSAFAPGTWLVATTAEDLGDAAGGPYGRYMAGEVRDGGLEELHCERFVHRRAMSGEPVEYRAVRARA